MLARAIPLLTIPSRMLVKAIPLLVIPSRMLVKAVPLLAIPSRMLVRAIPLLAIPSRMLVRAVPLLAIPSRMLVRAIPLLAIPSRMLVRAVPLLAILGMLTLQSPDAERSVEYFRVSKDFIFNGQKIVTVQVKSLMNCAGHCLVTAGCTGMNYQTGKSLRGKTFRCEVLSLAPEPANVVLLYQVGWSAYRLDTTTPESSPSVNIASGVGTKATTTIPSDESAVQLHSTTTTVSFVDTNPEYCTIDGAFVFSSQIYLVSGQVVYTYSDIAELSSGPIKTYTLSQVTPGISSPIDAIFTDATESHIHVIKGDTVTTYSTPSGEFTWTRKSEEDVASFFGHSYGAISDVFVFSGETVVILGDTVTNVGGSSAAIHSNSPHNVFSATNKKSAPDGISAASDLDGNCVVVVCANQAHAFTRPSGASQGTWEDIGAVKCRT